MSKQPRLRRVGRRHSVPAWPRALCRHPILPRDGAVLVASLWPDLCCRDPEAPGRWHAPDVPEVVSGAMDFMRDQLAMAASFASWPSSRPTPANAQ